MRPRIDALSEAGFTLTELLVALAVLALMSLLMLQGIKTASRLWSGSLSSGAVADAIQSAEELIRYRLERTYFETAMDAIPSYPFFSGSDTSVTFISQAPGRDGKAPLRRYTLLVTTAGDLVFSSISTLEPNPINQEPSSLQTEVLLHGVESLDLAYYDSGPAAELGWKPSWQRRSHPPALVRVKVNFLEGDHRWWPSLLVHPVATVDRDCQMTLHSGLCAGRS